MYAASLGVTPAHVAELESLVTTGRLNDAMARQAWDGVSAGEGRRPRWPTPVGCSWSGTTAPSTRRVTRVIDANPDVAQKIRDGKVQVSVCPHPVR